MKLATNTWFSKIPLEMAIKLVSQSGFRAAEIAATRENLRIAPLALTRLLGEQEVRPVCVSVGVPFLQDPKSLDLHSPSSETRKASVKYVFDSVDFASRIGAPLVYVCSVARNDKQTKADAERILSESLATCAEYAAKVGLSMALEHFPTGFLPSIADALELVARMPEQKNLGVVFDVGHQMLCSKKDNFQLKDPKQLMDVHINNNDGVHDRHWFPGKGIIKKSGYFGIIELLKSIGYEKYISVELTNLRNVTRNLRLSKEFMTDLFSFGDSS